MSRRYSIFVGIALLLAPTVGCVARHLPHPYEVTVRDAETGRPIPGATVGLNPRPSLGDDAITAKADDEGKAVVRVARSKLAAWEKPVWSASAPGYIACEERTKSDFERTPSRVIKLHPGPARLVVALPANYRGPVLIEKRVHDHWLQAQNGQRDFPALARSNGYVQVDGSPLMLKWLAEGETHLVDEQGEPIADSSIERVFRSPEREILVVGSAEQAGQIRQVVNVEPQSNWKPTTDTKGIDELFRRYREEAGLE